MAIVKSGKAFSITVLALLPLQMADATTYFGTESILHGWKTGLLHVQCFEPSTFFTLVTCQKTCLQQPPNVALMQVACNSLLFSAFHLSRLSYT